MMMPFRSTFSTQRVYATYRACQAPLLSRCHYALVKGHQQSTLAQTPMPFEPACYCKPYWAWSTSSMLINRRPSRKSEITASQLSRDAMTLGVINMMSSVRSVDLAFDSNNPPRSGILLNNGAPLSPFELDSLIKPAIITV